MKKLVFIFSFSLLAVFSGFTQTKGIIQKAWAFLQTSFPGTVMVDDNGKQVPPQLHISRFIYIEVKGKLQPVIGNVKYANENYQVAVSPVPTFPEEVGSYKMNRKKIILQPAPGNSLWRLELQGTEEKKVSKNLSLYNSVIITETRNRRHFLFITREIELTSPMTM